MIKNTFRTLLLAMLCSFGIAHAQTPIDLHITHKLGGSTDFGFGVATTNDLGNDFNVTRLQYYISRISITHDGGTVTDVPNHYILADGAANVVEFLGSYSITSVESISFYVGVDTPLNHADPSLQPSGHPLEPKSPSMHWGWAAGYRFVAIEGKSGSGLGQDYQVHALGDAQYYKVTVPVSGFGVGGKIIIALNGDYVQALKGIDVSSGVIAHGEGSIEVQVLQNFRDYVFSAGTPVSVKSHVVVEDAVSVYPNPAVAGVSTIDFGTVKQEADVMVTDILGKEVFNAHKRSGDNAISIKLNASGMYFVTIQLSDGSLLTRKLSVQ